MSNLCQQALKSLAVQLEQVLLSGDNPRVSMEGIRSFSVDLTHCQSRPTQHTHTHTHAISFSAVGFVMTTVSNYSCLRGSDASLAFEPLKQVQIFYSITTGPSVSAI